MKHADTWRQQSVCLYDACIIRAGYHTAIHPCCQFVPVATCSTATKKCCLLTNIGEVYKTFDRTPITAKKSIITPSLTYYFIEPKEVFKSVTSSQRMCQAGTCRWGQQDKH